MEIADKIGSFLSFVDLLPPLITQLNFVQQSLSRGRTSLNNKSLSILRLIVSLNVLIPLPPAVTGSNISEIFFPPE